jgi:IclR family transcriptional regulator, KDG regulon repressor
LTIKVVLLKYKKEPIVRNTNLINFKMAINNQVNSLHRAINVLECFLIGEELSFGEICKKTNLSNGTVYRILQTLLERDYISKNNKLERYTIGKGVYVLGINAIKNYEFEKNIRPALEKLALITKETANASIFYDNSIIFIDSVKGSYSIKMDIKIGKKTYINASAAGKVMLAYFDSEKIDRILNLVSLPKFTVNSITDEASFKKELCNIRKLGYAIDNEEEEIGLKCIAGPVFNYHGGIEGAISISGPTLRIDQNLNNFIDLVIKTCNEISLKLGFFIVS